MKAKVKKKRGNPNFVKGKPQGRPPGVLPRPRELLDMMHVYRTEGKKKSNGEPADHADDTPGQTTCRKFCREDAKSFMQQLHKMQGEWRAQCLKLKQDEKDRAGSGAQGTAELVVLIGKLLAEWNDR